MRYLLFIALITLECSAGQEQNAYQAIFKATYSETGIESNVDKLEKHYENLYVDDTMKFYGGYCALIVRTITTRQASLKWSF
jgi:hypothetical protein